VSLSIIVVCEAAADRVTACRLADRVLCEQVEWLDEDLLPSNRKWRGLGEGEAQLLWRDVAVLAKRLGLRVRGHFNDEAAEPDAQAARRALNLIKLKGGNPNGVLLIRDADDEPERLKGLNQARMNSPIKIPIALGVAFPKREAWVIAGFEPSQEEQSRLDHLRKELGFDPTHQAHKLTATGKTDKKSAKRVHCELLGDDPTREAACLETEFATLRIRGEESGLAAFLDEVQIRLVPLFITAT